MADTKLGMKSHIQLYLYFRRILLIFNAFVGSLIRASSNDLNDRVALDWLRNLFKPHIVCNLACNFWLVDLQLLEKLCIDGLVILWVLDAKPVRTPQLLRDACGRQEVLQCVLVLCDRATTCILFLTSVWKANANACRASVLCFGWVSSGIPMKSKGLVHAAPLSLARIPCIACNCCWACKACSNCAISPCPFPTVGVYFFFYDSCAKVKKGWAQVELQAS